ncbi:hypothetical protein [Piscirickettsia salmonis]|uniref:hypothetical protein n=1 Tax=Piscirickettsia salmonis TaxID=1238 RepID=UPI0006BC5CD2|nr:hypothetical protein [Piscirickettsia salmonis]ALA26694.1 primase [Piscirickettsia salmonis]APS45820.1 hypothetical protein AVI48_15405 [Piscirickettsia salmonis]APS49216.1 hypothetical protein AVI49_16270 [Piscirickettsia salmonis]QGO82309.1 hypothetical protein Psal107_03360 [Piscirickettsia salmonis]QGP24138.1 hypothetical protein Psal158_03312 [Piscirickettsia salmonis]
MSESESDFTKLEWETIEYNGYGNHQDHVVSKVKRAKIHGGWLVESSYLVGKEIYNQSGAGISRGAGIGLTFVPDPKYQWLLNGKKEI